MSVTEASSCTSADGRGGPPRCRIPWVNPVAAQRLHCPDRPRGQTLRQPRTARALADASPAVWVRIRTPGCPKVEAIGRNSNFGHLCKNRADLRKRISDSPARPPQSRQDSPKPRSKRFLTAQDEADIAVRYEAGETTQQIGSRRGISKTRVATILREHGIAIRRQGLTNEQVSEATDFYGAGRSLAWIAARFGVSHTTIATALRQQGILLRPRPGWRYALAVPVAVPPQPGSPGGCRGPRSSTD
jgi:hypothetical protein